MIYKFKSSAAADLIMMGPAGDHLLRLIGKEPAPTGIITVAAMPAALASLEAAIAAEAAAPDAAAPDAGDDAGADAAEPAPGAAVTLRQRAWPLVDMLRRSHAEQADVVWGV